MILGADGKKLSKRHGATNVEEYRDAGYLSDAFVNYLALLGWSLDGETTIVPRDVLASKFSLDHVSKNPATFDPKKLDLIQAEYIRTHDRRGLRRPDHGARAPRGRPHQGRRRVRRGLDPTPWPPS